MFIGRIMVPSIWAFLCFLVSLQLVSCSTERVVLCIGDSITHGLGSSTLLTRPKNNSITTPFFVDRSYPGVLQDYFKLHYKYSVVNLGVRRTTMLRSGDYPYWNTDAFKEISNINPSIVIVQFGTNDAKVANWNEELFEKDYFDMIAMLKALPSNPRLFISVPPPMYAQNLTFTIQSNVVNNDLPRVIPGIARAANVSLINLFRSLGGFGMTKSYLFFNGSAPLAGLNDGVHPNDRGYEEMAYSIASILYSKHIAHTMRMEYRRKFFEAQDPMYLPPSKRIVGPQTSNYKKNNSQSMKKRAKMNAFNQRTAHYKVQH